MEQFVVLICYAISIIELILDIFVLPISVLNFYLIFKTSIIHINLRWLLICQCSGVTIYAVASVIDMTIKLSEKQIFEAPNQLVIITRIFGLLVCTQVGIFLTIERVIATLLVRRYEKYRKPFVAMFSFTIIIPMSIITSYGEGPKGILTYIQMESYTLILAYACTVTNLASYLILIFLNYYNTNAYKRRIFNSNSHSLTERYQMSENIRTSRQLSPSLLLHFLTNLIGQVLTLVAYYQLVTDEGLLWLLYVFTLGVNGIAYFFIQLTVIQCHPFLRRQAVQMLRKMCIIKSRIYSLSATSESRNTVMLSISGNTLITANEREADTHFQMLSQFWHRS
ncbi:sre G protein-coupled chemoreceptor domain-containing protein [Ditylenchus destructor]|nr:sre G protein-coupled chemoreceptor domain-containing protein [Ditylenchus destructor]